MPLRRALTFTCFACQVLNEDVDVVETKAKDKGALVLGSGKGARRATRLGSTAALVLRNEAGGGRAELHSHEEAIQDIWPLQLVDLGDDEQCATLYRLLRRLPHVALHYLATHVFPTTCRHQGLKLSACGQALGGEYRTGIPF